MKTFAFLFNPVCLKQIREFWPITHLMPDFFVKSFLKGQGFKIFRVKKLTSAQHKEIQGYFIVSPLLPEQLVELDEELILDKIISASFLARDIGADLLGLGGYASVVADKKPMLTKHLKTPVTSGASFTAWSVIEAIYRIAEMKKLDLKKLSLLIIGAHTPAGALCAKKLCGLVAKTVLISKNKNKLEKTQAQIMELDPHAAVEISENTNLVLPDADIVIFADAERNAELNVEALQPGAMVIDICLSRNIAGKAHHRKDITVVEGGIIKLPKEEHLDFHAGMPKDMVCAAMAETMLLALEEKSPAYSLGENINMDTLEEIANMGVRHGFEVYVP